MEERSWGVSFPTLLNGAARCSIIIAFRLAISWVNALSPCSLSAWLSFSRLPPSHHSFSSVICRSFFSAARTFLTRASSRSDGLADMVRYWSSEVSTTATALVAASSRAGPGLFGAFQISQTVSAQRQNSFFSEVFPGFLLCSITDPDGSAPVRTNDGPLFTGLHVPGGWWRRHARI